MLELSLILACSLVGKEMCLRSGYWLLHPALVFEQWTAAFVI